MAETQELQEFNRLLGQRIRELVPVQTVWAKVKSVDWDSKSMTATGQVDDLDYEDVQLGSGYEFRKPKAGTLCLLGIMENNPANVFLIDAAELEEVITTIGDTQMTVTPAGVKIERQGENMFTCISDMIDEVNKIIVINGTSINVAAMNAIKTRFNKVLIE